MKALEKWWGEKQRRAAVGGGGGGVTPVPTVAEARQQPHQPKLGAVGDSNSGTPADGPALQAGGPERQCGEKG